MFYFAFLTGVNISFDASNANLLSLLTTGSLTMSVAWAVNEDGAVLVPPTAPTNHVHRYLDLCL